MNSDNERAQRRLEYFKAKLSAGLELQRATSALEHAGLSWSQKIGQGAKVYSAG